MLRRATSLICIVLGAVSLLGCGRQPAADAARRGESAAAPVPSEEFLRLMNTGRNHLEQGDATNALTVYRRAASLVPQDADVHLNLANAYLLAGDAPQAIREADLALQLAPNTAAPYFIQGSAHLRLARAEEAVKALENVRVLEPGDTATCFQLGRARMALQQWDAAIAAFKEGLALDPDRLHTAARYLLAQSYLRAGREAEGRREIEEHLAGLEAGGNPGGIEAFERSKFTRARVPFVLEQPDAVGISVRFVDATPAVLGDAADRFTGPVGLLDPQRTGWPALFAREHSDSGAFRLLWNSNGVFHPDPASLGVPQAGAYSKVLVGDLQNDRFDDVVVLGDRACHVFRFGTNGQVVDATSLGPLGGIGAVDGALVDLDFTGKLDLVVAGAAPGPLRVFRQFGPLAFTDITATSGVPSTLRETRGVLIEDWNRDGLNDVVASRASGPPLLMEKRRGGRLVTRDENRAWPAGAVLGAGDFDNDLRPDLVVVNSNRLTVCFHSGARSEIPLPDGAAIRRLVPIDHDNDGWLDLWAVGAGVHAWRNRGLAGFDPQTAPLGLEVLKGVSVVAVHFADFDQDCDSDALLELEAGGLRFWRNDGGHVQAQIKVHLVGNRSNASGLGCKIEIETAGLRLSRTVQQLPVEIGVGRHRQIDSLLVHWFNWPQGSTEIPLNCQEPILAVEAFLQEGSCPFLYAWDGQGFRFVTDFLGAAPLGLPVREGRSIEADPEEYVWIGDEASFPARDGRYQVRLTEELREVLYLDEARLVVVDRAPGVEVHPTDKLLPGGPFPPGTLWPLHREQLLQRAITLEGRDVTAALRVVDGQRVSPPRLRAPQLRGLAEPHGVILDFGPLDPARPLVLVLNGWLRFGGGMANIAAAHDPALPYPFPVLEAEAPDGSWEAVDVVVGAPAGKTKTILVDLEGRLKVGTRRLRLTSAFEIHWDRAALLEKERIDAIVVTRIAPDVADLHYRGFGMIRDLPPDSPLTPDYDRVTRDSQWSILPEGWSTRYGDVRELIAQRDEGLVLVHSGDELSLDFQATSLPPQLPGRVREFFLYVDGWDKDADFHVVTGAQIEPLPFHGQDAQRYGRETRPAFPSDALHRRYNTRWVDGRALKQAARR